MSDARGRRLTLTLDTATRHPTLALVGGGGELVGERQWESQHRHGEQLLQELDALLAHVAADRRGLGAVVCGIGPGSFTGLRIGLATAKTIAYSLGIPLVGISTTESLALAADAGNSAHTRYAVTLPAGATDRYVHRVTVDDGTVVEQGPPQLVVPGEHFDSAIGDALLVAVHLDNAPDISDEAAARGEVALRGLARALARLGMAALSAGRTDDVARLVPAYVALPRGIEKAAADMTWSPDLR